MMTKKDILDVDLKTYRWDYPDWSPDDHLQRAEEIDGLPMPERTLRSVMRRDVAAYNHRIIAQHMMEEIGDARAKDIFHDEDGYSARMDLLHMTRELEKEGS